MLATRRPQRSVRRRATCPRALVRAAAERIGVFAEPEVVSRIIAAAHPFLVLASDGVWEFLPSQSVVDMVRAPGACATWTRCERAASWWPGTGICSSRRGALPVAPAQVSKFDDPHEACLSVVAESYRLWLQHETRTDDITMVVMQFQGIKDDVVLTSEPMPTG